LGYWRDVTVFLEPFNPKAEIHATGRVKFKTHKSAVKYITT